MMHVSRSVVVIGLKLNLLLKLLRKPQHKALHYRYYDVCNCTIKLLKQEPPERVDFCCGVKPLARPVDFCCLIK